MPYIDLDISHLSTSRAPLVRKDQERDELEITIEKAEVMKDQERVEPADIDV